MDNLTHTLVGLMMARCGLEKTVRGAGMMMLAANAPDIDAITWFDRVNYLDYHRGYTHAFALAPVVALLPMALARMKFTWRTYLAALACVLTHPLLDWTNPFGLQMYLPFSPKRAMLDITNVIDPWIWLILLTGAFAPMLMGAFVPLLTGARAPTPPDARAPTLPRGAPAGSRRGWAVAALALLLGYEGLRFSAHAMALEVMASRLYDGAAPQRVLAVPVGINPFVWRGIVETGDVVRILPVSLRGEFDSKAARVFQQSPPGPAIDAARRTHPFQVFLRFSRAPFWKATSVDGGTLVELIDLRFGSPDAPGFGAVSTRYPK